MQCLHCRFFLMTRFMTSSALPTSAAAFIVHATVVADTKAYLEDEYNVGEREVAGWLQAHGYHEQAPGSGVWTPGPS